MKNIGLGVMILLKRMGKCKILRIEPLNVTKNVHRFFLICSWVAEQWLRSYQLCIIVESPTF